MNVSKSLGVMTDETLTWHCHVDLITKKVNSGLYVLKRLRYLVDVESSVFFGDKQVPVTHSFENLGVEIDENLTWEKHIAKVCKKASAGIGAI